MPDLTAAEVLAALTSDPSFQALSETEKGQRIAGVLGNGSKPASATAAQEAPQAAVEGPVLDDGDGYAELGEFLDDTLRLSAAGEHYDLPACDIETGLECQMYLNVSAAGIAGRGPSAKRRQQLDDAEEADLFQRLLGGQQTIDVPPLSVRCPDCGATKGTWCILLDDDEQTDPDHDRGDLHPGRGEAPNPRYLPQFDIWARLKAEGKSWPFVQHMGTTAMMWAAMGREFALEFWKTGGRPPKAAPPAPAVPQDRLPRKTTSTRTTGRKTTRKATAPRKSSGTGAT